MCVYVHIYICIYIYTHACIPQDCKAPTQMCLPPLWMWVVGVWSLAGWGMAGRAPAGCAAWLVWAWLAEGRFSLISFTFGDYLFTFIDSNNLNFFSIDLY